MKRCSALSIVLSLLFGLFYPSVTSAEVTISDSAFNPSNWQDTIYLQDPGARLGPVTTEPTGGNPGAHRQMAFQWDTLSGTALIFLFSRHTAVSYTPSVEGAITFINYSEDGRVTSDSVGTTNITLPARMGLEQNGTIYRTRVVSTIQSPPFPGPWQTLTLNDLQAGHFPKVSGPGPDYPDFSNTGSEIFFGYIRGNGNYISDREIVTSIDNWSVTIAQQADPTYTISNVVLNDAGAAITTAEVGDTITYRITFANTGGVDMTGVEVTDTLPLNLQYNSVTATPAAPFVYDSGPPATVTWPVGAVASGESARLDIVMDILSGANLQTLTNQAEVTAIDAPAVAGQTATVDLEVRRLEADLEFVLVMMEDLGDVGGGVYMTRVTSTVRNNGPDAAVGALVVYEYAQMLNSPEAVITGDPVGDLMVCEDRPVGRQFYCELPSPHMFDAGVTAELVVDYVRTGNPGTPEVTMTATTYDPFPSNNDFILPDAPPPDNSGGGGGSGCFIGSLVLF